MAVSDTAALRAASNTNALQSSIEPNVPESHCPTHRPLQVNHSIDISLNCGSDEAFQDNSTSAKKVINRVDSISSNTIAEPISKPLLFALSTISNISTILKGTIQGVTGAEAIYRAAGWLGWDRLQHGLSNMIGYNPDRYAQVLGLHGGWTAIGSWGNFGRFAVAFVIVLIITGTFKLKAYQIVRNMSASADTKLKHIAHLAVVYLSVQLFCLAIAIIVAILPDIRPSFSVSGLWTWLLLAAVFYNFGGPEGGLGKEGCNLMMIDNGVDGARMVINKYSRTS
ncbi:MAG: hypothetical protein IPH09_16760 [bacterium]|nr:hypothetical protein [bacterium]